MTNDAPVTARPKDPSFFASAARVFELSLGQMLWSRRTIFLALVVGGPIFLAIVSRLVQASGVELPGVALLCTATKPRAGDDRP